MKLFQNLKTIKTITCFIGVLFLGMFYLHKNAEAACRSCPSGWYECNGGTMCCFGAGCPSWGCGWYECVDWNWTCDTCTTYDCWWEEDCSSWFNCRIYRECEWRTYECGCHSECVETEWRVCYGGCQSCVQIYCGDGICDPGEEGWCGDCCTVTNPSTPVLYSPASGINLGRASSVTLDWSDVSWGEDCGGGGDYYYIAVRGINSVNYTSYGSALSVPLRKCNGNSTWQVWANNGAAWSGGSSVWGITQSGFVPPTVTSIYPITPSVGYPEIMKIGVTVNDPDGNLSWVKLYVDGTPVDTINCSGNTCTVELEWSPTCSDAGTHTFTAVAADDCGYTSPASTPVTAYVEKVYNLQVSAKSTEIYDPETNNNVCPPSGESVGNVSTWYTDILGGSVNPLNIPSGGSITFRNIPESILPITLDATYLGGAVCEKYELYCLDGKNVTDFYAGEGEDPTEIRFDEYETCETRSLTIGVGEEKKISWETILDGDLYAKDVNVSVDCDADIVGGNFAPYLLADEGMGGFARSADEISSRDNINNGEGGFAKNLDIDPDTNQKSLDIWLNNFEFPDVSSLDDIGNINSIAPNKVYRATTDSFSGTYNIGDGVAVVYVDGDMEISGDITSTNPDSFVVFVVNGNVNISSDIGFDSLLSFTKLSPVNVKAGIIALGDITFSSGDGEIDMPIIVDGFLVSRSVIRFNRDLEEYNDTFPAHVIKFYDKAIAQLTKLEENVLTGLATYDVQWIYEK